jgi:hypothetical protein
MKLYAVLVVSVALAVFTGSNATAQIFSPTQGSFNPFTPAQGNAGSPTPQVRIAERLFTVPVLEPTGFVAVCLATNLDIVARDLTAQIIDANGADATQTSSCGARVGAGATCDATAHFANNSPLRCVISTSGSATTLRGGMTTSSGPFPFTSPADLAVPAQ